MLDIYSFINSKDIREYLKSIDYKFTSIEAAWLIYQANDMPFKTKKEAWLELMDTMDDSPVQDRQKYFKGETIYPIIKEYIQYTEELLDELKQDDNDCIYEYSYLHIGDSSWSGDFYMPFKSYSSCIKDFEDTKSHYNDDISDIKYYIIRKKYFAENTEYNNDIFEVEFLGDGNLLCIDSFNRSSKPDRYSDVLYDFFESMWFNFPTPFVKGDIVWIPTEKLEYECDGGLILDDIITWGDINKFILETGDNTDMSFAGYFMNSNGTVYHEVNYNYMNLEYYKEPYKINEKFLLALSEYIKDEVTVDFLLCAYRKSLLDVARKDIMLTNWYCPDWVNKCKLLDN